MANDGLFSSAYPARFYSTTLISYVPTNTLINFLKHKTSLKQNGHYILALESKFVQI